MKIIIATDHNGVKEKETLINHLKEKYDVIDLSQDNTPTDDYPVYAFKVANYIKENPDSLGILMCGTGIGMSIAANKVKGIRCAHISNINEAKLAKFHNNANIIALSYKNDIKDIIAMTNMFIITDFAKEERHIRRLDMISTYESGN